MRDREPLRRSEVASIAEAGGTGGPQGSGEAGAGQSGDSRASTGRLLLGMACLGAILLSGSVVLLLRSRPAPVVVTPAPPPAPKPEASPTVPPTITVHVSGAVRTPGLVPLATGGRVADAVAAAGGMGPDASPDALNLARRLVDGERVHVPRHGEPAPPVENEPAGAPAVVDLNTADQKALESLPGVGPALAMRIIDHRRAAGGFRDVRQLLEVPGIGEKLLSGLRDRVTVSG